MVKWIFLLTIVTLPIQVALNVTEGADMTLARLLVPVVFIFWLVEGLVKKKIIIPWRIETFLLSLFLLFSVISLAFALDWERGVRKALYLVTILPIYLVAADLARDRKARKAIIKAIIASGVIAALSGIIQFSLQFVMGLEQTLTLWKSLSKYFLGSAFSELVAANSSWLVNVSGNTIMRAFGFFPDPHMFSAFVSLVVLTSLGVFMGSSYVGKALSATAGIFAMVAAVALSFSRGAWVALVAGGIFFTAVLIMRRGCRKKIIVGAVLLLISICALFSSAFGQRMISVFNLKEGSNAERLKNWKQAAEIISTYPLNGIGLGNYAKYIDPQAGDRSPIYAHNIYLDISAETGIANGIIFILLLAASIARNVSSRTVLGLGIASACVYFAVHGIFDNPLWSPQVMVIFLSLVAIGSSLGVNHALPMLSRERSKPIQY